MATAFQLGDEFTAVQERDIAPVRMQARFIMATLFALVFTGAIRKWAFPGVSVLYLLQDVPIGIAYLYALWSGLFTRGYMLLGVLLLSVILCLQGMAQIIFGGLETFVAMVGLHNYIFYFPILLAFPLAFTLKVRNRFIWWNLVASIPMCLLAVAQAQSPRTAWGEPHLRGGCIRRSRRGDCPCFRHVQFHRVLRIWVASVVAYCMGEWLLPVHRRAIKSRWLLNPLHLLGQCLPPGQRFA